MNRTTLQLHSVLSHFGIGTHLERNVEDEIDEGNNLEIDDKLMDEKQTNVEKKNSKMRRILKLRRRKPMGSEEDTESSEGTVGKSLSNLYVILSKFVLIASFQLPFS